MFKCWCSWSALQNNLLAVFLLQAMLSKLYTVPAFQLLAIWTHWLKSLEFKSNRSEEHQVKDWNTETLHSVSWARPSGTSSCSLQEWKLMYSGQGDVWPSFENIQWRGAYHLSIFISTTMLHCLEVFSNNQSESSILYFKLIDSCPIFCKDWEQCWSLLYQILSRIWRVVSCSPLSLFKSCQKKCYWNPNRL